MPVRELDTATDTRPASSAAGPHPDIAPMAAPAQSVMAPFAITGQRSTDIFSPRKGMRGQLISGLLTVTLLGLGAAVVGPALFGPQHTGPVIHSGVQGLATTTAADGGSSSTVSDVDSGLTPPASVGAGTSVPAAPVIPPAAAPVVHPPVAPVVPAAHPGGISAASVAPSAVAPCTSGDMGLTLTLPKAAAGVVTVRGALKNISGHSCASYGDTWTVDFSQVTPARALYGNGGGAATSTGRVIAAGAVATSTWDWNQQDCSNGPTCIQVGPGQYRAAVSWNGATANITFLLGK